MGYPQSVRQRALELCGKGMNSFQVHRQLAKEGFDPVPAACTVRCWVHDAKHGVKVSGHHRSAAEIAAVVREYLTTDASGTDVALRFGVSRSSVCLWALEFAPDEEKRRGMSPEQLEQATLWRVEKKRRTPRKSATKSSQPATGIPVKADGNLDERPFDRAALPDDPDELKAMLEHERFMRLADQALFRQVMKSAGKAPARRTLPVSKSQQQSKISGDSDTR